MTPSATATDPAATAEVDPNAVRPAAADAGASSAVADAAAEGVVSDVLVEEISIDGMCGVY